MSALIIDQLIKSIIIKLDSVIYLNAQMVENEKQVCRENIDEMKRACKEKMEDFMAEYNIAEEKYKKTINFQQQKIEK